MGDLSEFGFHFLHLGLEFGLFFFVVGFDDFLYLFGAVSSILMGILRSSARDEQLLRVGYCDTKTT